MADKLHQFLEMLTPYLTTKRRELHEQPELGFTEYVTTYKLDQELRELGFTTTVGKEAVVSSERVGLPHPEELRENEERARKQGVPEAFLEKMLGGHTGLVAQFDTGRPGKNIALRFDIDALPIIEASDEEHTPAATGFRSTRDGVMHACGHDGHATIGLGVAKFIHHFQEELSGSFTLLFQAAEEGGRGAKPMVAKGWLDDIDAFMSGHIGVQNLPVGEISATTSKFFASTKFNVTYKGKSAHAGLEPNAGRNALLAAASASLHLNGITRHADGATRVNIGKLNAGSGRNIIADLAKMEIETRGETTDLNEYMNTEALRILKASAALFDVELEYEIVGKAPSATCDEEWVEIVSKACETSGYVNNVIPCLPLGASEDATYMVNHVQDKGGLATFMLFPSPLPAGHHHPRFDYDEKVLVTAVDTFARTILELNEGGN
ncbi:amidohydrolase [Bacillus sp. PS06]|uniref:amidohydrolase n=1 Tax=Bacillus sp. PS06 TaxID=2764176 RepID=UPI00177CF570|nr:amidohydrolase [Bacillus sp. PS06]MBD8071204.1 amidohydrolase [Bacillus sp. PS06]